MEIFVGLKWSALRVEIDPLNGAARVLPGRFGPDPASLAALEWALLLAGPAGGRVTVATVGPEAAEAGLRQALGLGAGRAIRVEGDGSDPAAVAEALAGPAAASDLVLTGAWSIDGASAAVAPTLAALLGRPQACGLLALAWQSGALVGERRLPAGRRERVRLPLPAVASLEAGTIARRREPLPALLAAREAPVEVVRPAAGPPPAARSGVAQPYRPRPRTLPARPTDDDPRARIAALTGALEAAPAAQQLFLDPPEAAAAIVDALRRWGYLG